MPTAAARLSVSGVSSAVLDQFARLDDRARMLAIGSEIGGFASLAGAKSGALGIGGRREKLDVLPMSLSRRARRSAIDARRAHGVNEHPIRAAVAFCHRSPAFLIVVDE
jgi:hypothetical protein